MGTTPLMKEDHVSQIPALQVLQNLGYGYLTSAEALAARRGKPERVVLETVLADWLRTHARLQYKGSEHLFSESNIASAVEALTEVQYTGLVRTNESIYDLICLGKSLEQLVAGDRKSFTLHYIDWEHPENNIYHMAAEFGVTRPGLDRPYVPDIVLFVNGIPLVVIECKRPDPERGEDPIDAAIEEHALHQREDGIPRLFQYAQLLLAINKNDAKYGTVRTPRSFWSFWREDALDEAAVRAAVNAPLAAAQKDRLFADRFRYAREHFDALEASGREVTAQDRALYCLCWPERLLELAYRYVVFDAGEKKIARYQQYFCVRKITARITGQRDDRGGRQGGVVWHTQGSGKSLTMVMLAKAIALEPSIGSHKIVLVTDRVDLDDQIYTTFKHCGKEVSRARSGKGLARLLMGAEAFIVTTVIDKFESAVKAMPEGNPDRNVFVLVDESHRGQYGLFHAKMRLALPNACYLGFTGTPIMRKDKSTVDKFGGMIDIYNLRRAVDDKAVVPLLYEGRHVAQNVEGGVDSLFDAVTDVLTEEQTADLKRKFATADQLNKAEPRVMRIAMDISEHFRDHWQGSGLKAQLVAPDKSTALLYKQYLDYFGKVTSEVLISAPDQREGDDTTYEASRERVRQHWDAMVQKYGTEAQYNKSLINAFKHDDHPEIIIVVDKLLVGFDAPRNTVLYLTRRLREHALLQAIARVNRLHENKDFGYILDYRGVLEDLDQALSVYAALPEFDQDDLKWYAETLRTIDEEVAKLPQRHSDLWDVFRGVSNKRDEEEYERYLADEARRVTFHECLIAFRKTLAIALSSEKFLRDTDRQQVIRYQRDLRFFEQLRSAVRLRYAERVDYSAFEPKIKKLIDTHVTAGEVEQVTPLVDIFNEDAFADEVEKLRSPAAKADTIAHRTHRTIIENMDRDPVFYRKFSAMLRDVIEAFRQQRLHERDYLREVTKIMQSVVHRTGDAIPGTLQNRDVAKAYFGLVSQTLTPLCQDEQQTADLAAEAALAIDDIINDLRIVNWTTNSDIQNRMRGRIEDHLCDLRDARGIDLSFDDIDAIMESCLDVAKVRCPNGRNGS
jgi:type I restriction enzyme R subunit